MKKKEFLDELKEHLVGISKEDRVEIMQDYEEHFKAGKRKGRGEAEISRSLGDPRVIARDIRRELSGPSSGEELKSEAIETWVAVKKFGKHVFTESRDSVETFIQNEKRKSKKDAFVKRFWIIVGLVVLGVVSGWGVFLLAAFGVFVYSLIKHSEEKKRKSTGKKKIARGELNLFRLLVSLVFNVFFFIWFWISVLFTFIGLLLTGLGIVVSGAIIIGFSIFALISHSTPETKDVLLALLFGGLGVTILGGILFGLFEKLTGLFFNLTKKYVELNSRFVRK